MHKYCQSTSVRFPELDEEIMRSFPEMKPDNFLTNNRATIKHPRISRKPVMGICSVVTTACVTTVPGTKCIFNDCANSKGFNICMECQHWSNPSDPCHLEKVSRNYCPAILRHRDSSL